MTRRINPKKIKNHGPPNVGDQKRLTSDSLDLTTRQMIAIGIIMIASTPILQRASGAGDGRPCMTR